MEGFPHVELVVSDDGSEIGTFDGRSYRNGDNNIFGLVIVESLGSDVGTELGSSDRISGGKVYGKLEEYLLIESLGS